MRRDEGSNPFPVTNTANMPDTLDEFDITRIQRDLEQLKELIERKQWLWENTSDPDRKAQIADELQQHADLLTQTQALIQ